MAMEVIFFAGTIHDVRHDLETFFWLLVWVLLRHTNHEHEEGRHAVRLKQQGHRHRDQA